MLLNLRQLSRLDVSHAQNGIGRPLKPVLTPDPKVPRYSHKYAKEKE